MFDWSMSMSRVNNGKRPNGLGVRRCILVLVAIQTSLLLTEHDRGRRIPVV
jgi:hypothetical protein